MILNDVTNLILYSFYWRCNGVTGVLQRFTGVLILALSDEPATPTEQGHAGPNPRIKLKQHLNVSHTEEPQKTQDSTRHYKQEKDCKS